MVLPNFRNSVANFLAEIQVCFSSYSYLQVPDVEDCMVAPNIPSLIVMLQNILQHSDDNESPESKLLKERITPLSQALQLQTSVHQQNRNSNLRLALRELETQLGQIQPLPRNDCILPGCIRIQNTEDLKLQQGCRHPSSPRHSHT